MEQKLKEFIFSDSEFEKRYFDPSGLRYWGFKVALNLFIQRGGRTILETGCARQVDDWGAGMSTVIFGYVVKKFGLNLHTVDNNPEALKIAKELTTEYKDFISYNEKDSIDFLKNVNFTVNLLYLDSFDYPDGILSRMYGESTDIVKALQGLKELPDKEFDEKYGDIVAPCQEHQLKEFKIIEDQLSTNAIVLLDDNNLPGGGKTRLTKEYLLTKGWVNLMDGYQSLWIRGKQ